MRIRQASLDEEFVEIAQVDVSPQHNYSVHSAQFHKELALVQGFYPHERADKFKVEIEAE